MLNRVIRHTRDGYELEADLRHAELISEQLELQSAKAVVTPGADIGVECKAWTEESEENEVPASECTRYRAIVARCNYLQPDRREIQYAVKLCCRIMPRPMVRSWEMLKRIGKHLKGKPRLIWRYGWQDPVETTDIMSNAN